ncbi:MAG: SpaA isopeptide-forming pilin-related protein, partial [Finegoldia magna]|nr:SpaA isopeptide-forming pilin-related protein [Finegoldia magna]
TLSFTNIEDTSKVYTATSDENGDIVVNGIVEGTYKITVTHVPTGYKVVQKGKMVSEVKGLFRPEAEVKAENNVEEAKKEAEVEIPEYVTIKGAEDKKEDKKEDEKVIDGGTIVVEKEKDNKDEKKPEDNKKPEKEEKENNKKPAKPAKQKKALPKAGAAAEAATIAAAAMATMGGAYLSLKKRK